MVGCCVSAAYEKFKVNLDEIQKLRLEAKHIERNRAAEITLLNALNRASTVLLCSRIEAYVEDVFLEAWEAVGNSGTPVEKLPVDLRVQLFAKSVRLVANDRGSGGIPEDEDEGGPAAALSRTDSRMKQFVESYAYLWIPGQALDVNRSNLRSITNQLNNPSHKNVRALFRHFGLPDIFSTLEVEVGGRKRAENLKRELQDIVDRRHKIAHGDADAKPTSEDVGRYLNNALWLCRNLDAVVGVTVEGITGDFPWEGRAAYADVQAYRPLPAFLSS